MVTTPSSIVLSHHDVEVPALVWVPDGDGPHPAVVLAAEAYGINRFTHDVAADLCAEGHVVVVPDYYRGHGLSKPDDYSDFTEVMGFIGALDFTGATHDIVAGIDHARSMPEVDPARVVVWGYCTGGTLAMLATCLDRELAASVWFFPSQPTFPEGHDPTRPFDPVDLLWAIRCPVLVIYGDDDPIAPPEMIEDLRARFARWQVDATISLYPGAGHAFSAPDPPLRHDEAARTSWIDATAFLHRHTDHP